MGQARAGAGRRPRTTCGRSSDADLDQVVARAIGLLGVRVAGALHWVVRWSSRSDPRLMRWCRGLEGLRARALAAHVGE